MNSMDFSLAPGIYISKYRIVKVLGVGGFGVTYQAEDTKCERLVAIKEYLPVDLAARNSDLYQYYPEPTPSKTIIMG